MSRCAIAIDHNAADPDALRCRCGSNIETVLAGNGRTGVGDVGYVTICRATRQVIGGDLRNIGVPDGDPADAIAPIVPKPDAPVVDLSRPRSVVPGSFRPADDADPPHDLPEGSVTVIVSEEQAVGEVRMPRALLPPAPVFLLPPEPPVPPMTGLDARGRLSALDAYRDALAAWERVCALLVSGPGSEPEAANCEGDDPGRTS